MILSKSLPLIINGWTIYFHPLFLEQFETLNEQVSELRKKDETKYKKKNATKRLAAIIKLVTDVIPQNPTLPVYRQGNTLGNKHKHWFRAKFFQQYRLFFRYYDDGERKIIIFAWVNDEKTKRAYDSKSDAYRTFQKMLNNGHPPSNWDALLEEAQAESERLQKLHDQIESSLSD